MDYTLSVLDFVYEHMFINTCVILTDNESDIIHLINMMMEKDYPCSRLNSVTDSTRILVLTYEELSTFDVNKFFDLSLVTTWFIHGSNTFMKSLPLIIGYSSNPNIISLPYSLDIVV